MEFVKGKEITSALDKLDSDSKENILNALNIAEEIEASSKKFYESHAKKTKGTELEAFFRFLSKEEETHLNKIIELKNNVQESKEIKINFPEQKLPKLNLKDAGKSEMTAMLFALWREKKAYEFYLEAMKKTSGEVKEFFKELAEFEKEHV